MKVLYLVYYSQEIKYVNCTHFMKTKLYVAVVFTIASLYISIMAGTSSLMAFLILNMRYFFFKVKSDSHNKSPQQ